MSIHPLLRAPLTPEQRLKLATLVFADTISGRMLRDLMLAGRLFQADFMREYHVRCDRKPTAHARSQGKTKANPSAFLNNFGRYVTDHRRTNGGNGIPVKAIEQTTDSATGRNVLYWLHEDYETFLRKISDACLTWVFTKVEKQMLSPRATDRAGEHQTWLFAIREEMQRRLSDFGATARQQSDASEVQEVAA